MPFHTYPPRILMLSLSDPTSRLIGKIASLNGLQVVQASHLWEVKFFENQRGIVIVILEVRECCDTFRIIAEVQEQIPSAPLIIITEPDQNGQDQLALRLGARYVIRKPCNPVEIDRLFRFMLEDYGDKGDCWASMKQDIAKLKATPSESLESGKRPRFRNPPPYTLGCFSTSPDDPITRSPGSPASADVAVAGVGSPD